MCGIIGFVTTEGPKGSKPRLDYLTQGLVIDILRGEDSTGVLYGYGMQPGQQAGFVKDAVDGYTFIKGKGYRDMLNRKNQIKFAVGHNRASTLGGIKVENAHPFKVSCDDNVHSVVGLHNGTVRGDMDYLPKSKSELKLEVDSNVIMANLAHVDPGDARRYVIEKIDGAYMLVWSDSRDGSLNFARNDTRHFHFAQSYDEDTLYFSSEAGQVQWLSDRNMLGCADVMSLDPGQHLKFTEEGGLEPEVFTFDPFKRPKYQAAANNRKAVAPATKTSSGPSQPTSSVVPPGKFLPTAQNKVMAMGRKRPVPQLLQEELLELGLAVEDRIHMKPMSQQRESTAKRSTAPRFVSGFSDTLGLTLVVHRVEPLVAKGALQRCWTVRPTAVRWMDATTPLIIAELVATVDSIPECLTLKDSPSSATKPSTTSTEESQKVSLDGYEGPGGSLVSKAVWLELTRNNCVVCKKPLFAADHKEVRWDLISDEPQCKVCAKHDDEAIMRMAEANPHYYH